MFMVALCLFLGALHDISSQPKARLLEENEGVRHAIGLTFVFIFLSGNVQYIFKLNRRHNAPVSTTLMQSIFLLCVLSILILPFTQPVRMSSDWPPAGPTRAAASGGRPPLPDKWHATTLTICYCQ